MAAPLWAQKRLMAEYVADIDPEDYYNSCGTRLTSFAALIAQVRANYHRIGTQHRVEGNDPIFASREMRARIIPALFRIESPYQQYVASSGQGGNYLVVQVYGYGNRITRTSIVVPG